MSRYFTFRLRATFGKITYDCSNLWDNSKSHVLLFFLILKFCDMIAFFIGEKGCGPSEVHIRVEFSFATDFTDLLLFWRILVCQFIQIIKVAPYLEAQFIFRLDRSISLLFLWSISSLNHHNFSFFDKKPEFFLC